MRLCLETGRTQYSIQRGQGINVSLWCKGEKFISCDDILGIVVIFSFRYIWRNYCGLKDHLYFFNVNADVIWLHCCYIVYYF